MKTSISEKITFIIILKYSYQLDKLTLLKKY